MNNMNSVKNFKDDSIKQNNICKQYNTDKQDNVSQIKSITFNSITNSSTNANISTKNSIAKHNSNTYLVNQNNNSVYLNTQFLKNPLLSFSGFYTYVALRRIQNKNPIINVNINYLFYILTHVTIPVIQHCDTISRSTKDFLKKGLTELIDLNIITLIQKDKQENNFILDLNNIFINVQKGNFFSIPVEDLISIFKIKNSLAVSAKLLKYYCLIVSYFPKNTFYTTLYLNSLAEELCLTRFTLLSYNQLLQEAKILYICKNNTYYNTSTKEMEHLPSVYALYKHKQQAIEFNNTNNLKFNSNTSKFKQTNLSIGNKHRSISMKYNHFCKNNNAYSPIEVLTLYEQIIERNNDFINSSSHNQATPFLKSLDPFIKYFEPYKLIADSLGLNIKNIIQTLNINNIKITDLNAIDKLYGSNIKNLLSYYFNKNHKIIDFKKTET